MAIETNMPAIWPKSEKKDGNQLTFSENGHIRVWRTAIEGKLKKHEIEFEKKYY